MAYSQFPTGHDSVDTKLYTFNKKIIWRSLPIIRIVRDTTASPLPPILIIYTAKSVSHELQCKISQNSQFEPKAMLHLHIFVSNVGIMNRYILNG